MEYLTLQDRLIAELTQSYVTKLFYFCLKKTGNSTEAEDLTQDITVNAIIELNRGTIPKNFSAWIWQIARNRYSIWATEKHTRRQRISTSDIGDYEISDDDDNIEGELIQSEQMSLLRRELAFTSNEYRNVVIAYYIEGKKLRDIASSLSISTDTARQRLHRARIILKEGMNMAREFGKRSYNPEDIRFIASGSQPSGLPWSVVQRKIPKNILLEANNNPSTMDELSVELGIALPYIEEEVEILHRATLLKKIGDKYITNFFILDRDCQQDTYNALRRTSKERSTYLREMIEDIIGNIRDLGIASLHTEDNVIKWWLVPYLTDLFTSLAAKSVCKNTQPPKRDNGEEWGFAGYENYTLPEETFVGHNGCGNQNIMFWFYKFRAYDLWDQCGELYDSNISLFFGECIIKNRNVLSFTDSEKVMWKQIDGRYAHSDENGNIVPDVMILTEENNNKLCNTVKAHPKYDLFVKNIVDTLTEVETVLKKYNHKVLEDSVDFIADMQLSMARMMSIHDLVDSGYLALPSDPQKSTLGMHLFIK